MCGLTGVLYARPTDRDELRSVVTRMTDTLRHRGPDDSGVWVDDRAQVGLGFRRLSILDLSANGHQPMESPSGRFVVVYNGEIYNHAQLREDLLRLGYTFRGHSDTETLCAAFEEWGIEKTIVRCIGMFAVATWDRAAGVLSLIRDRLGIKPLFIYSTSGNVLFGSELKALKAHPAFEGVLDAAAINAYLRYLYVPAPAAIFRDVQKVRPGHIMTIDSTTMAVQSRPYWSLREVYARGKRDPFQSSEHDAINELETLLLDAVRLRKLSDVPVGALLSGGIDSSTVVALMQRDSTQPVRTFSVRFDSPEHDESIHAARIARHLGTDHTELDVDGKVAMETLRELPTVFDEPLSDPSQIPTLLVCRLARQDVTVALTGDGGDEVFAGYHRYIDGWPMIERAAKWPRQARRLTGALCGRLAREFYPIAQPVLRASGRQRLGRERLLKLGQMLSNDSASHMYRSLLSAWQSPEQAMGTTTDTNDVVDFALAELDQVPLLDRMMLVDQNYYLSDDLLAKVDRASMATSLEARVPLLDHRVIEFSWRLPVSMKIRDGVGKWLLRQVLYRHVPRDIVDRPKVGFTVPIEQWLRGPLRNWADGLLHDVREPLNRPVVLDRWRRFQRGEPGLGLSLWAVTMLQDWRNSWESN